MPQVVGGEAYERVKRTVHDKSKNSIYGMHLVSEVVHYKQVQQLADSLCA